MALLNVKQVKELMDVPESTAYKIIRDLNRELKDNGVLVLRGRVEERYLKERYGISETDYWAGIDKS